MNLLIFHNIGFGFCPRLDSEDSLTFRYVPPRLCDSDPDRIRSAFNLAAARGATDERSCRYVELDEWEPAASLTAEGGALFEAMPVFGVLTKSGDSFEWSSHWEEEPVITFRSEHLDVLLEEALRVPPQNLWAQKHFRGITSLLYGVGDADAPALAMAPPLPPMDPGLDDEGFRDEDTLPRAAVEERVEAPWGLWKTLVVALQPEKAATLSAWEETEQFQVLQGTFGVLRENAFSYDVCHFLRWDAPAVLIPSIVRWADKEELRRDEPWAPLAIMPSFDWDTTFVSIPVEGEELAGLAGAVAIAKPLNELQPEYLAWLEAEIRKNVPA